MEDWHDIASIVGNSVLFAALVTSATAIFIVLVARGINSLVSRDYQRTWNQDLKMVRNTALVTFFGVFLMGVAVGYSFSDMCGTGDTTEVWSPDSKHKVEVYSFDCGATTDYSLMVSLLRANQRLLRHHAMDPLYSHYHQRADHNFEVVWADPSHVTVRVEHLDPAPAIKKQDGVEVKFLNLN